MRQRPRIGYNGNMLNGIRLFFLIVSLITSFVSCTNYRFNKSKVQRIRYYAVPRNAEYFYGCYSFDDFITKRRPLDTVIVNTRFIKEFISYLDALVPNEDTLHLDIYMAAVIEYRSGRLDTLCFAHYWKFGEVYNSISMQPDSLFYDYIIKNAYAPLLPKYWKIECEIERAIRENDTVWFKNNRIINNDTIHEEMVPFIVDNP